MKKKLGMHYSRASATDDLGADPRTFSENEDLFRQLLPDASVETSASFVMKDSADKDITKEIIRLWEAVNQIYSVDESGVFQMGDLVPLIENAPAFNELKNYDQVVAHMLTPAGLAQLEQTKIGGSALLIQKRDGKVYRMGSFKTGQFYDQAVGMSVVTSNESLMTLRVQYKIALWDPELPTETGYANFTIAKQGDNWLVENYIYPEALAPEQPAVESQAFFVPAMDAEQERYKQAYVQPILLTGLLMRDWSEKDYTMLLPDPASNPGSYLI